MGCVRLTSTQAAEYLVEQCKDLRIGESRGFTIVRPQSEFNVEDPVAGFLLILVRRRIQKIRQDLEMTIQRDGVVVISRQKTGKEDLCKSS